MDVLKNIAIKYFLLSEYLTLFNDETVLLGGASLLTEIRHENRKACFGPHTACLPIFG